MSSIFFISHFGALLPYFLVQLFMLFSADSARIQPRCILWIDICIWRLFLFQLPSIYTAQSGTRHRTATQWISFHVFQILSPSGLSLVRPKARIVPLSACSRSSMVIFCFIVFLLKNKLHFSYFIDHNFFENFFYFWIICLLVGKFELLNIHFWETYKNLECLYQFFSFHFFKKS